MKNFYFIIILLSCVILNGCFVGYTTADGESLKQYLQQEELKTLIENPNDSIWIIDVRPSSSYIDGHIPSAKSFPSSDILSRLEDIPKDKYLIMYCETGGRAQAVIKMLTKEGYTKMMNWGSYKRWKYEFIEGKE